MKTYRQGDVLLVRVDSIPEQGAQILLRTDGRIVLAYGESTGHSHTITAPKVKWIAVGKGRYLDATAPFDVFHQEHAVIRVPAGCYRVIIQREYALRGPSAYGFSDEYPVERYQRNSKGAVIYEGTSEIFRFVSD